MNKAGFDAITNHERLNTDSYESILLSLPPNTIFFMIDEKSVWKDVMYMFLHDMLNESKNVFGPYIDTERYSYPKFASHTKELWLLMLEKCRISCNDAHVVEFAVNNALKNFEDLKDEDIYITQYFGETSMTFCKRMRFDDPYKFLSWFGRQNLHLFQEAGK
jgi:hypothetical protein